MGDVIFADRKTGAEVTADFPLHPGLVSFKKADGTDGQLFRVQFDQQFAQKVPTLPTVNAAAIPSAAADETPSIATGAPPSTNAPPPASHVAWFQTIFDELKFVRSKVDEILTAHPALQAAIDRVEQKLTAVAAAKVDAAAPAIAPIVDAVAAEVTKSTDG